MSTPREIESAIPNGSVTIKDDNIKDDNKIWDMIIAIFLILVGGAFFYYLWNYDRIMWNKG